MYKSFLINNQVKLDKMLTLLKDKPVIALDTETTGLNPITEKIVGISLCFDDKSSFYIPLNHADYAYNLNPSEVIRILSEAVKDKIVVMHNAKFDYRFFKKSGWTIENEIFDTMIADYLLDPGRSHKLDNCSLRELDIVKITTQDLIGDGENQTTFDKLNPRDVAIYACEDAYCTFMLYHIYLPLLKEKKLYKLFRAVEMPLMRVLAYMEDTGVYVNTLDLLNLNITKTKYLKKIEKKIKLLITDKKSARKFNPGSNDDLKWLLYTYLSLPANILTEKGRPSVSHEAIIELAEHYADPLLDLLLEYKKERKLLSFIQKLPKFKCLVTSRVHGNFNQCIARTGRLTISFPSLQNIPTDKALRSVFIAQHPDYEILGIDFSQIELRLIAVLAPEPSMLQAFKDGVDIHTLTASKIFKKNIEKVTKSERKLAKGINFGINYGMGSSALARDIGVAKVEGQQFIDDFFNEYAGVKDFHIRKVNEARRLGYVSTPYGRRRYFKHINSNNKSLKAKDERQAKNFPIQGFASDLLKVAMIKCYDLIKDKQDEIKMVLSIHDELVFEVLKSKSDYYRVEISKIMESVLPRPYSDQVKLTVDAKIGPTWFDVH